MIINLVFVNFLDTIYSNKYFPTNVEFYKALEKALRTLKLRKCITTENDNKKLKNFFYYLY